MSVRITRNAVILKSDNYTDSQCEAGEGHTIARMDSCLIRQ